MRWPDPKSGKEVNLRDIHPEARPGDEAIALRLLNDTGYLPRLNDQRPGVPTYYWCLSCNTCLRHRKSAFCDRHRPAYIKKRRRLRDQADAPIRVPRSTVKELHRYLEAAMSARNLAFDRQAKLKMPGLSQQHPQFRKEIAEARDREAEALRALGVLMRRELPVSGPARPVRDTGPE